MVSKKRSKKFNISNKLAYTLMIIALVVGLGVGVIALSAGETPNPGHNIQSVGPPDTCSAGQVLTFTGSSWSCTTPSSGSSLTKGNPIYKCPASPLATNYCANVQLTRNGIGPCIGQFANQPSGCFTVDANCAYTGTGTCTLVGYMVS